MEREIQEAAQLKTKFVSIATHELRSPLTALYESVSQVLDGLMGPINDLQRQLLEITRDNLRRMVNLTTEILDFQKFDAGKMPFDMKEEDLLEAIQTVYQTMHSLAEQKGLRLLLQLPGKLPQLVFDRDKIVQVLVNLINNAIKFTEKGNITLSVSQEANMIHVSVKDTGPGMKSEDVGKLFQPFGQVGSHKVKGTGLGLSICKEIIEGHHGRVWAESKIGEGTAMHFAFPIKERRQVV
jgi:signal transduction histidine kinase